MIKAFLFDMDGVLLNSEPAYIDLHIDFMKEQCIPFDDAEIKKMVGNTERYQMEYMSNHHPNHLSVDQIRTLFYEYCDRNPVDYGKLINDHVVEIFDYLKDKGYHTAVCSSSFTPHVTNILKLAGVFEKVEFMLCGDMPMKHKPDPEVYLTAAKKLNVTPEECLVIEDSVFGIQAGKSAGMQVIAMKEKKYGTDQSLADYIVEDLIEIEEIEQKLR